MFYSRGRRDHGNGRMARWLLLPAALLLSTLSTLTAVPASATTASATGEFLVAVDGDAQAFRQDIAAAGGKVEDVYGELQVLAVTLPGAAAARLDRRSDVEVEPNPVLHAFAPPPSYGLDRIDQRSLPLSSSYTYPRGESGAGVDVYVMDTGVRADHTQFGGRVAAGFTAYGDGLGTGDCNGHGTHVAGTIGGSTVGVAPSVRIVPVRILNCTGSTTTGFEFLDGMNWVLARHQAGQPAVLNLSLGSTPSSILDGAVQQAVDDGITVIAAAGNSNADACAVSPARVPAVLTVASSTATDSRASYSNYGGCVDLFAPGGDPSAPIYSASKDSTTALVGMMGTSMAAPHVAGAAARYLSTHPSAAPAEVAAAILDQATGGVLSSAGAGTPNRLLYLPATGFGPPVGSEVKPAYDRAGGPAGYLGLPTGAESCGLTGGGCSQDFQGGSIDWSPASGAHATDGAILATWRNLGSQDGYLGYPSGDPVCIRTNPGCSQEFQGGTITWTASTGAAAVDGAIRSVWAGSGGGPGWLGYPVASPVCGLRGGACVQGFQTGSVVWSASLGAIPIDGAMWRNWASTGSEAGILGYPTARPVCGASGCTQRFEQGQIRWSGSTGAHALTSTAIQAAYDSRSGAGGYLGQPVSDTECASGGCEQHFQGGVVYAERGGGAAFAVDGAMLARLQATGGVTGPLGYPTGNPACADGGCTQRFERGQVLWSGRSGAAALLDGPVAVQYRSTAGTSGYLGWPTGDTVCGLTGGGCKQQFTGGAIYGVSAAYPLDGAILARWLQEGAETGPLGYPVASPVKTASGPDQYRQAFEHGSITWTAAGGAVVGGS